MKWVIWFILACAAGIAAVLAIVWASNGFAGIGLSTNIAIAAVLGIVFTCGLGVGLMAAIFYSRRSGQDDEVHRVGSSTILTKERPRLIDEPGVLRTAKLFIDQHGEDPASRTAMRADDLLADGDMEGSAVWWGVLSAIEELQRRRREGDSPNWTRVCC
ncbi:MAG: hypothetical protein QOK29_527 [Rhodospirillaceae bacterium]|jgi:hypothetical protein|nr:hypothetical protein [Rhodospirillaceae bacterium]